MRKNKQAGQRKATVEDVGAAYGMTPQQSRQADWRFRQQAERNKRADRRDARKGR